MIRIHIKSDGSPEGTSVTNAETGEAIPVISLTFKAGLSGTTAVIEVPVHSYDIETEADIKSAKTT